MPRMPLDYNRIRTEDFNNAKTAGKHGKGVRGPGTNHQGWDLAAQPGTAVYAIEDGEILYTGPAGKLGQIVQLRFYYQQRLHCALYAHLGKIVVDPNANKTVRSGDIIGYVGTTGNAKDGPPHLHFEIVTSEDRSAARTTINPKLILGDHLEKGDAGIAVVNNLGAGTPFSLPVPLNLPSPDTLVPWKPMNGFP